MKRTAWCLQCDKPARGWDIRTTSFGVVWIVSCHGVRMERAVPWAHLRHRAPAWYFESLFTAPFAWRDRRPPT